MDINYKEHVLQNVRLERVIVSAWIRFNGELITNDYFEWDFEN